MTDAVTPPDLPSTRPFLTMKDAIEATRSSESTIKRRRLAGQISGAIQSDGRDGQQPGTWLFPVDGLIAAGFRLYQPSDPDQATDPGHDSPGTPPVTGVTQHDVDLLRAEHRAVLAERLLLERDRLIAEMQRSNESLRLSLRILGTGTAVSPVTEETSDPGHPDLTGVETGVHPRSLSSDLPRSTGQQAAHDPSVVPAAGAQNQPRRGWRAWTRGSRPLHHQ